jgi:hypothetical protein
MVICRTILEDTNLVIRIVICCGCLEDCHLELKELKSSVFIVTKKKTHVRLFVAVIRSTAPENHQEIEREGEGEVPFLILLTV